MKLTEDLLKELAATVMDPDSVQARAADKERYLMFEGSTREVIERAIRKEFKKQNTVTELINRLVPLNIMQKVIGKLAGVYKEAPVRKVVSEDETEQEMLNNLVDAMDLNSRMKEANQFFKMNKKALIEPYLDDEGVPSVRVLPAHTYHLFSWKTKKKSMPNVICKIDEDHEKLVWWTDESHFLTNYKGEVERDRMSAMDNEEGENPYGILHFVFINQSSNSVCPIPDDDLVGIAKTVPVVLTDLMFGLKYQCWAILWTVGKVGDIPFNPNSVIQMEFGEEGQVPSVNQIKPEIDSDKMLNAVMALVGLLLTTKNLQVGAIAEGITVQSAPSGISKMIDSSESVEDKKDQQKYFLTGERKLFGNLKVMVNYWQETGQLAPEFDQEIPEDFAVTITFQDPMPVLTEGERVDTSDKKIKAKLSTIKRELKRLYPDSKPEEIDALYKEILEEQKLLASLNSKPVEPKDGVQPEDQA